MCRSRISPHFRRRMSRRLKILSDGSFVRSSPTMGHTDQKIDAGSSDESIFNQRELGN